MYNIEKFAASMGLPAEEIKSLYETFAIELREEISLLKKAVIEENTLQISSISHNIKGITANMEMEALYLVIKSLNDDAKKNIFVQLEDQVLLIEKHFLETLKVLELYYKCTF